MLLHSYTQSKILGVVGKMEGLEPRQGPALGGLKYLRDLLHNAHSIKKDSRSLHIDARCFKRAMSNSEGILNRQEYPCRLWAQKTLISCNTATVSTHSGQKGKP